jgi:hypothetical protein
MSTMSHWTRVLGVAALTLGVVACTADYVSDNTSPILFRIAAINGGAPLTSDVGNLEPDLAEVVLAVRPKNQNFENVPQVPMAVFVERYEVRFFRSDGRNTEGVDVPYRISGNITTVVDVGLDGGANVAVPIEVVRTQAKLEPPLRNIANGGGELVLTAFAEITIFGRTVAEDAVVSSGRLQIDFVPSASTPAPEPSPSPSPEPIR